MFLARAIWTVTLLLLLVGCRPDAMRFDTQQGQPLEHRYFYGHWRLDQKRTNQMGEASGLKELPASLRRNLLGDGWRFDRNQVLVVRQALGSQIGSWRLEQPDTLVIRPPHSATEHRFSAQFRAGYLHLRNSETGRSLVFAPQRR